MQGQGQYLHLLVVDDDEAVRLYIKLQLEDVGYRVTTAVNGADALDLIHKAAPDLVISDILMPELDGFGLCRAIREDAQLNHIPFVFLTAHYLDPEDQQLAQRLGAARYIIKTADQDELLLAVKEALANYDSEKSLLALRFPELAELACELHLERLYAQLSKKVQQLVHSEANLAQSEARYRSILESAPDSIVVTDQQGCITLVNQQTETLFGYSRDELIGRKVEQLIAPELAQQHVQNRSQFLASQQLRLEKRRDLGLPARSKDGTIIPVEINLGSLNQQGKVTVTAIIRDIRDRLHAEEKILYLNRVYKLLSRCNQALVKAADEARLLDNFCRNIVEIGGYTTAWVGYSQPNRVKPFRIVASVNNQAEGMNRDALACDRDCPACQVLAEAKAQAFDPQMLSLSQRNCLGLDADGPLSRGIVLPLIDNNLVFGVLTIMAAQEAVFDDQEELRLLNELAGDLSFGISALRMDIAKRQSEAVLHLRERALDAARNGILLLDALAEGYPVVYVNPAFCRITGYELADLQEHCLSLLVREDSDQSGLNEIRLALHNHSSAETVLRSYRKDNSLFWNEIVISPVPDESGVVCHFVVVINDISERMTYQASLEHRSNHDPLTQLPNRNLLNDRLQQALIYSQRHAHKSAILIVDLDRFKNINDSLSHEVGDRLICEMARRLSGLVAKGDTLSRWGGDEFVLVFPDIQSREEVAGTIRRILNEIAVPVQLEPQSLTITCSIGCSFYPDDATEPDTLLQYADAAMYRAKELGGNRFQFFEQAFTLAVQARFSTENALRQALIEQQLEMHYQPVIDLATGAICGAEALVRWNHPEYGLVAPGEFIPIAEESGLIVDIGNQVIEMVCRQLKTWQDQGLGLDHIAINVAAKQFSVATMHADLSAQVAAAGLVPGAIEFELTETVLIQDQPESRENLRRLKASGFSLSLDDFGTGYSSLNYLRKFPVNRIKIDQSFVRDLSIDSDCASLVLTILSMAKSFHCTVVAEGVETLEQLQFLQQHQCDYIQGFYFSKPLPAIQFEALVRSGKCLAEG
tara:strand:- start:1618 stop:4743 length:3126 start_codon:yes stop_codon:yes gene_type:complete